MDASPSGAGLCAAPLPESVVAELWPHSEQKGYYTRLESPAVALLREKGFEPEPVFGATTVEPPTTVFPLPPSLCEGILFDTFEVFSLEGTWSAAHAAAGLNAHPGLFGSSRPVGFVDLEDRAIFSQLAALAARAVIREWHFEPAARSFCNYRFPKARSSRCPLGFRPDDPSVGLDNRLGRRLALLLAIIHRTGRFFSVVQGRGSFFFRLHGFKTLAGLGSACSEVCSCAFGSPFKRPSVWFHNKPWVVTATAGSATCSCSEPHVRVEGTYGGKLVQQVRARSRPSPVAVFGREPAPGESLANLAVVTPVRLCQRIAAGSLEARRGFGRPLPLSVQFECAQRLGLSVCTTDDDDPDDRVALRAFHDDPEWIGELADCLEFSEVLRYRFARQGHINVQEARAYKTWLKFLCRHHRRSRALGLIDSRVLLGAAAKGRSSSAALGRVLLTALPYVLGGGLYPGGLHVYSEANRSDGPSRGRSVAPPTKDWPVWLHELCEGRTYRFDVCLAAARVPKLAGRWLRLLLLLGGDIERHPGPVGRLPRGPLDLSSGFATSTRQKMSKSLEAFKQWLAVSMSLSFAAAMSCAESAAAALRGFGLHLYSEGHPRYLLVYAITAVQDAYPAFRNHLTGVNSRLLNFTCKRSLPSCCSNNSRAMPVSA